MIQSSRMKVDKSQNNAIVACLVLALVVLLYSFFRIPQNNHSPQLLLTQSQQLQRLSTENIQLKKELATLRAMGMTKSIIEGQDYNKFGIGNQQDFKVQQIYWNRKLKEYTQEIDRLHKQIQSFRNGGNNCGQGIGSLQAIKSLQRALNTCQSALQAMKQ